MNETIITNKDYTGISVDDLVNHLNLDDDLVNTNHLESLINASVDWVDSRINGFIVPTTLEFKAFKFTGDKLVLNHKGFSAISSFKINGEDFTEYWILKKHNSAHIYLNSAVATESTVEITYSAGTNTPNNYIQATLIVAADMYDTDRSNYSTGVTDNRTVMRLLNLE